MKRGVKNGEGRRREKTSIVKGEMRIEMEEERRKGRQVLLEKREEISRD